MRIVITLGMTAKNMKILIIDNYDSFTFNLYQMIGELFLSKKENLDLVVKRNDEIDIEEIREARFDKVIISPGPGNPQDEKYFGVCAEVLTDLGKTVPVLGVCLGMQGLAYYYGGKIIKLGKPVHGKTSLITHDKKGIFVNLPQNLEVMRYHSLAVDENSLPKCRRITSRSSDGQIMGLCHTDYPIQGVQFHPESFATEGGQRMLDNFLFRDFERV